jgi:hypothetical protein
MITLLGLRQQQLLTLLLQNKDVLTVENLSKGLGITDNAVRQHIVARVRISVGFDRLPKRKITGHRSDKLCAFTISPSDIQKFVTSIWP